MSRNSGRSLAVALAAAFAVAPALALANGQPVVSLAQTTLGSTGIIIYSDRPTGVVSLPVRRTVTDGENSGAEYDTAATPSMVTSCSNPRSVMSGDSTSIECDASASAAAPHAMPTFSGSHNAALWNLRSLPPSVR